MVYLHRTHVGVKITLITLVFFILCTSAAFASWAYPFVVNDGKLYVCTEERVDESTLGEVVGKVTYHTTREGTYGGNFSNAYPKGTRYYAIQGVASEEAIAVKANASEGVFYKANYEGEYHGPRYRSEDIINWIVAGIILVFVVYVVVVVIKKRAAGSYKE